MNWDRENVADSFKIFKQRLELYFATKKVHKDDQVAHILLQIGEKGLRMYNAMTLTDTEKKDPAVVFQKLGEQIEPAEHFRVSRLKLMSMRQAKTESLDEFVTRAQLQAQKCEFDSVAELEERLIELIISSMPIEDFQRKLLEQQKGVKLADVIKMGRTFEATASHVQQLQTMADSASISAIKSSSHLPCRNCGGQHKPRECPAHGVTCHTCGKTNHFAKVCRSGPHQSSRIPSRGRGQRRGGPGSRGGGHQRRPPEAKIRAMQAEIDEESFDDLTFSPVTISTVSSLPQQRDEAFVKLKIQLPNRAG